jgi:hypothetical protein
MVAILLALHAVSGLTPSAQNVLPSAVSESGGLPAHAAFRAPVCRNLLSARAESP